MKKMKLLIVVALQLLTIGLVAQTPQLINYQGVARDSNGSPISGNIGIKFEFRTGSASGAVVFTETQNLTTNGLGIFNTQIGKVNTSGISTLNWQGSNMFLEVSIDAAGGTSYVSAGVQQLVSVPYAMHAQSVPSTFTNNILTIGTGANASTYTLTSVGSSPNTSITTSGGGATLTSPGTNTYNIDVPATTFSAGTNVTIQGAHPNYTLSSTPILTLTGTNQLSISGGNTITLPTGTLVASDASLVSSGAATTATLAPNSFSIDVPVPTFINTGQNIVVGAYPNFTVNTPTVTAGVNPTITGLGAAVVTPSTGTIFTVSVPNPTLSLTGSSLSLNGSNTVTIPAPSFTGSGAALITTVSANNFSVHVPNVGVTLTSTGTAQSVSPAGTNSVSINIPTVSVNQGTGNVSVTGSYPSYTVSSASQSLSLLTPNTLSISGGNSVTIAPTLSLTGGDLSVGPLTNTINIAPVLTASGAITISGVFPNYTIFSTPAGSVTVQTTSVTGTGLAIVTSTATNLYNVDVQTPTFTPSGPVNITGSYPNYTINSSTGVTYTNGTGIGITSGSIITNTSPDQPVTISDGGNVGVTGAYPNFTLTNSSPDQPVTISNGGNIGVTGAYPNFTLSAPGAVTYTNGSGISITSGSIITNTSPDQPVTISNGGNVGITGAYPNFTLSAPAAASASFTPGGVVGISTLAPNSYSIGVPSPTFTPSGPVTITGTYPNLTINSTAPVTYTNGTGIGITSGSIITNTSPDQPVILNNGGNIGVTGAYPNFTLTNSSPDQPVTITNGGNVGVTGAYPNFTLTSAAASASFTPGGVVGISTLAPNSYSIGVPSPTFTPSGPVTITGTYPNLTINSTAPVTYTNGTGISITSGSIINNTSPDQPVTITNGGSIGVTGAYPNFTLTNSSPDQPVTISNGGNVGVTGTYPNFTLSAPGAVTYTNGTGISITSGSIINNTSPDQPVTVTNGGNIGVTGAYPNFTLTNSSPDQPVTVTNGGNVGVTGAYPNFTLTNSSPDQPVTISNGGNVGVTGTYPNFTLSAPAAASASFTPGGVVGISTLAPNSFSIGVPSPTFTPSGPVTITGTYPNLTINSTAPVTYTNGTGISITSGSIISNASPDQPVTVTNGGSIGVTGAYPNFTLTNSSPDQPVTVTNGGSIGVTGAYPNFTLTNSSPDQPVTITNGGNVGITGAYPNFTLTAPAAVSASFSQGGAVSVTTLAPNSFSISAPLTTLTPGGIASITNPSTNSFVVSVPAPTLNFTGTNLSISAGNTVAIPNTSISLSSTTAAGPSLAATGSYSYNLNIPPSVTPTITQQGILTQTAVGSSFTLNVPQQSLAITGGSVISIVGSNSVTIPNTGFVLTTTAAAGPALITSGNSFSLNIPPAANTWSLGGNAGTSPATNYIGTTDAQDFAVRTAGSERMRVSAAGLVGIGTTTAAENFQVETTGNTSMALIAGAANITSLFFGTSAFHPSGNIQYNTGTNFMNFWTGNTQRLTISGAGNVGIGNTAPNAPLQFANAVVSRKIVLYEHANNDHQVLSIGLNTSSSEMRYQVNSPTSSHIFMGGITAGSSREVMRIMGGGNVGIGYSAPSTTFVIGNGSAEKLTVNGSQGDMSFLDDQGSIFFPAPTATAQPMIYMLPGGTANPNRMILSHSPTYTNYGLQYEDFNDKFHFIGNGLPVMTIDLSSLNVGIGTMTPGINGAASKYLTVSATTAYATSAAAIELEGGSLSTSIPVGRIDFNSAIGTIPSANIARMAALRAGSASAGVLAFSTSDGTNILERMRITEAGNVGIGTILVGNSRLNVVIPATDGINPIGITATNNYTGALTKYGIDVNVDGAGSGTKYGISSSVVGLAGDASANYGYQVLMTPNGTGSIYGNLTTINSAGTGARYGNYTGVYSPAANTSDIYGHRIIMSGTNATAIRYGMYVTGENVNYFSGSTGIGISNPGYLLDVQQNSASYLANIETTNTSNGSDILRLVINNSVPSTSAFWVGCYNNTSVISGIRGDGLGSGGIYTTSDRRLKQNISDFTNTLDIISRLQPRQYEYKTAGIRTYGFIAQELNEVFPTAVVGSPDGDVTTDPMMVDYGKLTPLLTGGIKELHELVKKQSSDIEALKRQLEEQKALIDALLKK